VYFWVEDGVNYDEDELKSLADAFEEKMYPPTANSSVANGVPVSMEMSTSTSCTHADWAFRLQAIFHPADETHPLAHEYSNAHEMFLFNADNTDLAMNSPTVCWRMSSST